MISGIIIACLIYTIIKFFNLKISIEKRIITFLILFSIPLIYIQILIINDKLYTINVNSSLESKYLNLSLRNGFVGEKLEDKYIIYQENEDLSILFNNLIINKNENNDSFEQLIIKSNPEIKFNNIINKWLCIDYLLYKSIIKYNNELDSTTSIIYILDIKNDLKIKGDA